MNPNVVVLRRSLLELCLNAHLLLHVLLALSVSSAKCLCRAYVASARNFTDSRQSLTEANMSVLTMMKFNAAKIVGIRTVRSEGFFWQ